MEYPKPEYFNCQVATEYKIYIKNVNISYAKFQSNIIELPLIEKIEDIMLELIEKKIVYIWRKNIILPIQSKRRNMPIAKNYSLNILLIVISFSIINYYILIKLIRLL